MYILFAVLSLGALGLGLGFLLGAASRYFKVEDNPLIDEIERMMPGSQCGQCAYPGCRPAAEALVAGEAPPTLCPPGGKALAEQLANKLSLELDLSGIQDHVPLVARVDEDRLHWLCPLHQALPNGCLGRCAQDDPCRGGGCLHRLRQVRGGLSYRVPEDAPGENHIAFLALAEAGNRVGGGLKP